MLRRSVFMLILFICCGSINAMAQSKLDKHVSVHATNKPVKEVLKQIGKQGEFHFSYNSNILDEDSLVTLSVNNVPVQHILDALFDGTVEYKEKENHVILQRAQGFWYVSGYVKDEITGESIPNASVYEKNQLVASLTDDQGFFQLRLKDRVSPATINVSKAWYADTSLAIRPGRNQEITVNILPKAFAMDSVVINPYSNVEDTWLGKFFLSSRQRMQALNLNKFFVDLPYQASVLPGIGTHGKMGGQVTNKVSFNLLGGYAAGVEGIEVGGLFNIVKKDVRYAQVAGLFNVSGGKVVGVQVSGLYNHALDTLSGAQIAGLGNMLLGGVDGTQIAGLYNHIHNNLNGVQIGGLSNYVRQNAAGTQIAGLTNLTGGHTDGVQIAGLMNMGRGNVGGVQIAGLGNITGKTVSGIQIAGLFNVAKNLDGVQIGVINIADSSSGYSIGILNIVRKGYHKLSVSTNELTPIHAAFKAGNQHLYSILLGGWDPQQHSQLVTFGYGLGTELRITSWLSMNPEFTSEYVYLGKWNANSLNKLYLDLTIHITKFLSLYGGPSAVAYYSESNNAADGFRTYLPDAGYTTHTIGDNITSWIGWHAGINFF